MTAPAPEATRLLDVAGLVKHFKTRQGLVRAVDGVDFTLERGHTLGLVGESGSGKSTVARAVLRLLEPSAGDVWFEGRHLTTLGTRDMRALRKRMQMIFQDPYSSLDPLMRIERTLSEPLRIHGSPSRTEQRAQVQALLERVGLDGSAAGRFPREFSGGQRQRIAIARALAVNPAMIVCDEAVSALDVSIQAQILNLLLDLQRDAGVAYLFISHDLAVVQAIAHRVAVMYVGKIVELADCNELFHNPRHPYTQALLSAIPSHDPQPEGRRERIVLRGDLASPIDPPSGCRFRTRCWKAQAICGEVEPPLAPQATGHLAACHFPGD